MRSHADIIAKAGGPEAVHSRLGIAASLHTVRSWAQRDSIPGEYWALFETGDLASVTELANAAAARKGLAA